MLARTIRAGCVLALALVLLWGARGQEPRPVALRAPAPAFTGAGTWINSKPLDWKKLRGQVVVVHFWAFG
jgi:hypothetical protein